MVSFEFNKETGILESKFTGEVYLKEIVDYIITTKNDTTNPRSLKILTDATTADFKFSVEDLDTIIRENDKSLEKYDSIIDAIIVNSPKTTAISMLYKELEKNKKYKFNVFATKEVAITWLNNF